MREWDGMPQDARGDTPEESLRLWEKLEEIDRKALLSALSASGPAGLPRPSNGIQRALSAGAALTRDVLKVERTGG